MAAAVKTGLSAEEGNMLQCSLCLTVYKESLKECPRCAVGRKNDFRRPEKKKVKTRAGTQKKKSLKEAGKIKVKQEDADESI